MGKEKKEKKKTFVLSFFSHLTNERSIRVYNYLYPPGVEIIITIKRERERKKTLTFVSFFVVVFDSNFLAKSRKSHFYFCNFWLAHRQRLNHCYMLRVCVCLSVINDTDRSRHHQAGLEKERKKKRKKESICNNLRNSAARLLLLFPGRYTSPGLPETPP
jgi:hypothetical protein